MTLKYNPLLAINLDDTGSAAGVGDVVGPASATDNAVARYDSTTGKLIQDSTVIVGDTGNVTGLGTLNTHTLPGGTGTIALTSDLSSYQPLDSDLTTIAGLTATTDNFIQSKSSAWASRTVAQVKTDLGLTGTNSGDQTTIVGITGTKAQFDTAVTDGNILYVGDVTQYTDELAQDAVGLMVDTTLVYVDGTPLLTRAALTGDVAASQASNATTISNDVVTYAKMQNVSAASRLLGRGSAAGAGDPEEIVLGTNLSMSGTTLNAAAGGSSTWTETELDFGSTPVFDKTFVITDGTVTGTSKIMPIPSGNVATSRVGNDLEWDNLLLGALAGTGNFTLTAMAVPGPLVGKRKIFYQVAA